MTRIDFRFFAAAALCSACLPQLAAAAGCRSVAGTIDAKVIGGEPVNVLGNVSGDLAGATRAVIRGQTEGEWGKLYLTLAHDFVAHNRGSLKTTETSIWTSIPGRTGVFHMATDYQIDGGTGAFEGAGGNLINDGIVDTNTGFVTLRYSGEICMD